MSRKVRYLDLLEGFEHRTHLEKVAILERIHRLRPTETPPIECLDVDINIGILNKADVVNQVRECLDTQGVRFTVTEYSRILWSRIKFRVYLGDWHDLMVYLAVEQSLRKYMEAAA